MNKPVSKKKTYLNDIGSVLKGERGNYIKIDKDVVLPKGAKLYITPMSEHFDILVKRGVITAEQAEQRLEKLPDFVLSTITAVIDN